MLCDVISEFICLLIKYNYQGKRHNQWETNLIFKNKTIVLFVKVNSKSIEKQRNMKFLTGNSFEYRNFETFDGGYNSIMKSAQR